MSTANRKLLIREGTDSDVLCSVETQHLICINLVGRVSSTCVAASDDSDLSSSPPDCS